MPYWQPPLPALRDMGHPEAYVSHIRLGDYKTQYMEMRDGVRRAWSIATESLNADHPMSAVAGALGVKLEKPGYYTLNQEAKHPKPEDIPQEE